MTILKTLLLTGVLYSSAILAFTTAAWATPITYTLQGVAFPGIPPSPVTGMFDFDPTTSTYSNISITTSRHTYTQISPHTTPGPKGIHLIAPVPLNLDLRGFSDLHLAWGCSGCGLDSSNQILTDVSEWTCPDARCFRVSADRRVTRDGRAVPATVPEPSSILLLASGIAGLAGYRWQQRRREGTQLG